MKNLKNIIFYGLILLILVGIGAYLTLFKAGQVSNKFTGQLDHVSGNSIFLKGVYIVDGKTYSKGGIINVEAVINANTSFQEQRVSFPSKEELAKRGGTWTISSTTQRESVKGSLSNIGTTTPVISVTSSKNIFGKTKFTAEVVRYTVLPVYLAPQNSSAHETCEDSSGHYIGAEKCAKINNTKK